MSDTRPAEGYSRRQLLALGLAVPAYAAAVPGETHQATGAKTGEMTPTSARIWMRRTASNGRLANGIVRKGHAKEAKLLPAGTPINILEGSAAGANGYLRVVYKGPTSGASPWLESSVVNDFAVQTTLSGLQPNSRYTYSIETRATRNGRVDGELHGSFRTLPLEGAPSPVHISLLSCQMYCHMDRPDGFHIYESIQRDNPHFLLSCGDNVYYDNEDPIANSESVARYHWQRMYSLPTLVECLRHVGGYWQKDDHDVLANDAWPTITDADKTVQKMRPFTFSQGQRIFRQQVPAPPPSAPMYRTVKVGSDIELWLPDSRDHRSPNNDPDGPQKSIWGAEQKRWLMSTLQASRATWKILVNPNPIVGPDRQTKNDNHANIGFAHESAEIRNFLKNNFDGNVISVCGDRHWQYHSVDPESGLHEFGCGAASDEHASGTPGLDKLRHRFHRVLGGYVTMEVAREGANCTLRMRHRDVRGATVHEHTFARKA